MSLETSRPSELDEDNGYLDYPEDLDRMSIVEDEVVEYDDPLSRGKWEPLAPQTSFLPSMDGGDLQFETEMCYPDRGPKDFIISGPMLGGWGPGRWFATRGVAYQWAHDKYGVDRVRRTKQSSGRWAFLIKGL